MERLYQYEPKCKDLLGEFEALKEEEHREAMRQELKEEIMRKDKELFTAATRQCPVCSNVMHAHGKTSMVSYLAVCGEVRVQLKRLRCISCKLIVIPASVLIPANGISASLAEKMCDLASKMPYAKAAGSLAIQHNITMSAKRFWKYVQKESDTINDVLAEESDILFKTGVIPDMVDLQQKKPLIIGLDGGWVRGWQNTADFEVKCATVTTGSAPGPGRKRHLTDRSGYAAVCDVEDFRQRVSALAIKSGYLTASARIFVSDGASWISKMVNDWFPEAVHILDMFHLKQKVLTLFGINAQEQDASIRDDVLKACDAYSPKRIYSLINEWRPVDLSKDEAKEKLMVYVENNASAISNHKLVSIHGSGWIEKGVDLMVSRRMKNRGMSWTHHGSAHIIPFAVLHYNNQWGVYWNKRKGLNKTIAS